MDVAKVFLIMIMSCFQCFLYFIVFNKENYCMNTVMTSYFIITKIEPVY